jgi:hypothetical protein
MRDNEAGGRPVAMRELLAGYTMPLREPAAGGRRAAQAALGRPQ